MRDIIIEEHAKRYHPFTSTQARGFAEATRKRMLTLYDPNEKPADHARVLAALPSIQAVHNKVSTLIRERVWPHVVQAKREQAEAAAAAEAGRKAVDELGIGMPAPEATGVVCTEWMNSAIGKVVTADNNVVPRWSFVDPNFTKEAANTLVQRVRLWKRRLPSMKTACDQFETKIRLAYDAAFVYNV